MVNSCVNLTLDVRLSASAAIVAAKQGDTGRVLRIRLSDGGKPYSIGADCHAMFAARKPDGTRILNSCTIQGDQILYPFTSQTCAAVGSMPAEIKLYGADGTLLTSASFLLEVQEAVFSDGDEIASENEMNALDALILETVDLKAELEEKLETGAFNGPPGPEGPPGDGYALTDADIAEIARQAAQLVGAPGGEMPKITLSAFSDSLGSGVVIEAVNPDGTEYSYPVYHGNDGDEGGHYLPSVSSDGILTWTASKSPMPQVPSADIKGQKGDKGDPGEKGNPGRGIISTARTSGTGAAGTTDTYTITYTDGTTSTFTVYNGANGKDGENGSGGTGGTGEDGEDGATFIPYVDPSGNLSWSNDKGLANPATVNIKGEKGDKGDKGDTGSDGAKGDKGDKGDTGDAGKDGVSVTHSWNGTTLSVTSSSGTSSADLKGSAGYSPVRGTDYWTDADIAEIKSYVEDAILGGAW